LAAWGWSHGSAFTFDFLDPVVCDVGLELHVLSLWGCDVLSTQSLLKQTKITLKVLVFLIIFFSIRLILAANNLNIMPTCIWRK
jgi:hypothetical protein